MAAIAKQQSDSVQNALAILTAHMRSTILRTLASRAVVDRRHVTCALATADGRVVQVDPPARLAIVDAVLRSILTSFNGTLAEGDIVLTNDPFSGGTHLQDMTLVTPMYYQGTLVGYGIIQVPLPDIGGMALGGYYPQALEIWAEGVRVTPVKFSRGGNIQRDALTMLLLNSRLPHLIEKDLELVTHVLTQSKAELETLVARYTIAGYSQAVAALLTETEAQARHAIRMFTSDTVYGQSVPLHSCLEEREFRVVTRLSTVDDVLHFDFSDSSPAAKGFINATAATTKAAALVPFFGLWPTLPANDGLLRACTFIIPAGSLLNANVPMSVGWSVYEPSVTVASTVAGLIQQVCSEYTSGVQFAGTFSPPTLPFMITGCGRPGCPFPTMPRT